MAFSNRHKALTYELFGIPRTGDADIATTLVGYGSPIDSSGDKQYLATYTGSDHSALVTLIDARITAIEGLSDNGTENRIKTHLDRYDEIASSVLRIDKSPNGEGLVADDEMEVKKIRELVGSNMGLWSVGGGWAEQVQKAWAPLRTGLGDR